METKSNLDEDDGEDVVMALYGRSGVIRWERAAFSKFGLIIASRDLNITTSSVIVTRDMSEVKKFHSS